MAPSLGSMGKFKKWMFDYAQDPGKMLLHTATAGWILSAAGQVAGILTNKKTSKKEKSFLLPQEIADALINIFSFYLVTNQFQKFTKTFVSKGKVITPAIKSMCEKYGIRITKNEEGKAAKIGDDIAAKIKQYQTLLDVNKAEKNIKLNLTDNQVKDLQSKINELKHFKDEKYSPFENGFKVAGNVLGGVISGNIITPMLRNPMAAYKQKETLEREKMEHDAKLYNENKVILAQNNLNIDNYKSNVNTKITSGGAMRI